MLLVPFNAALVSAHALKRRVTGEHGNKTFITPAEVYRDLKTNARLREITCDSYKRYRDVMDNSDPSKPNPQIGLPQEEWDLCFKRDTAFDDRIKEYLDAFGETKDYSFLLILYPRNNDLKRIEIIQPELSCPAIIWSNGKGAFPNATS